MLLNAKLILNGKFSVRLEEEGSSNYQLFVPKLVWAGGARCQCRPRQDIGSDRCALSAGPAGYIPFHWTRITKGLNVHTTTKQQTLSYCNVIFFLQFVFVQQFSIRSKFYLPKSYLLRNLTMKKNKKKIKESGQRKTNKTTQNKENENKRKSKKIPRIGPTCSI